MGGVMTTVIPRSATILFKMSEVFSTAEDGQTAVDIRVLQGERPIAADKMTLCRFRREGSLRRCAVCPQNRGDFRRRHLR